MSIQRRQLVIVLLSLLIVIPGWAALDDAYQRDADFVAATHAVQTAEDDVSKAKADPDGPALTLLRVNERLQYAHAAEKLASYTAKAKIYQAYTDLLVAQRQVALSQVRQRLAQLQYQAAQVKSQLGAVSIQELTQAKDTATRAAVALAVDRSQLVGAELRWKPYGNLPTSPTPQPAVLDVKACSIDNSPTVIKAQMDLSEAQRAVDLAQGPDTAPLDRAALARTLATSEAALHNIARLQTEALDLAVRRYQTARENLALAQGGADISQNALLTAQKRFAAGAISQLTETEAEVAKLDSMLILEKAVAEAWSAHFGIFQATGGVL